MIFITLGSQKFQFNRLLEAVDDLIESRDITDEVFAQTGYSDYHPKNYKYEAFLDIEKFAEFESKADIVITHGGTGAIVGAVKKGKKVIALPRRPEFHEHVDDHQLQIVKQFDEMNLVCPCYDTDDLKSALRTVQNHEYQHYESNTTVIINSIESYLKSLGEK